MKVIILCAGRGRRFKLKKPKCLLTLGKKTLLEMCLNNLKSNNHDELIVIPSRSRADFLPEIRSFIIFAEPTHMVHPK